MPVYPSYPQTLWSSVAFGWSSLDHLIGHDENGAVYKALLLLFLFPFLPLIYLADVMSLIFRGAFINQPSHGVQWRDAGSRFATTYRGDRIGAFVLSTLLALLMGYLILLAFRSAYIFGSSDVVE